MSRAARSPPSWLPAVLFALVGLALLLWLVLRADPARLWSTVARAAPWVPVLVAIEGVRLAVEAWAGRRLYAQRIPYPLLLRATFVAYAVASLAPAGRASGEGVKAAMLRDRTGLTDTAAAATTIQTCSLLALGVWSIVCAGIAFTVSLPLAGTLAVQALVVLVGAAALRGVVRGGLLGRVLGKLGRRGAREALDDVTAHARGQRLREPLAAFLVSRALMCVESALTLFAVTRRFDVARGMLAFGVATISGSLGDSVPGQLGVMGGAFSAATGVLAITREDALAFALLTHAFQLVWIAAGLLTPALWRAQSATSAPQS